MKKCPDTLQATTTLREPIEWLDVALKVGAGNIAKKECGQAFLQASNMLLNLFADAQSSLGHLHWEQLKQSDVGSFTSLPVRKRCYVTTTITKTT